jgi:hypothetical protein
MLRIFGLGLAVCLFAGAARAGDDPVAAVRAIYDLYRVKHARVADEPDQLDPKYYSARRKKQLAALQKACKGKDMCLPDADHFVNGQDYKITDLQVKALADPATPANVAKVDVRFKNFETDEHFVFTMVREGKSWLIDEMEGGDKETRYTLDDTFKPNL